MDQIEIAGLRFGAGLPKLCVPLTAETLPALEREALLARDLPADLYEWRADCFTGSPGEALALLRGLLGKPLLCTLRTAGEGGKAALSPEEYEARLNGLLAEGGFQLLDVELSAGEERVRRLVQSAHGQQAAVVLSHHDFEKTPPPEEMLGMLKTAHAWGGDLPKLAVTPQCPQDVLSLMVVTVEARERLGPVITMSMGPMGKLSRVSGQLTGSCLTFGAGLNASAPGQLNAEDLRTILEDLSF